MGVHTTIYVSRAATIKFLTTRIATATELELSRMADMLLEDHPYSTAVYILDDSGDPARLDDQPGDKILDSRRVKDW